MGALTVTGSQLINIADTLGCAKTRCAAIAMAAQALPADQRDALAWLAEDAEHVINLAVDALNDLRAKEGKANG